MHLVDQTARSSWRRESSRDLPELYNFSGVCGAEVYKMNCGAAQPGFSLSGLNVFIPVCVQTIIEVSLITIKAEVKYVFFDIIKDTFTSLHV